MSSLISRVVRTINGPAHVLYYEGITAPPAADGAQGDWAVCLTAAGLSTFGPKTDDLTWPAAAVNQGPPGGQGVPGQLAPWAPGVSVGNGQAVTFGRAIYVATAAHTSDSSSFFVDLLAGKWTQLNSTGRIETVDPTLCSASTALDSLTRMYFQRVTGSGAVAGALVQVTAAAGNVAVALYRNNGSEGLAASPVGNPVAVTGSVSAAATGPLSMPFTAGSVAIADGDWLGVCADNIGTLRLASSQGATAVTGAMWQGRAGFTVITSLTPPTSGFTVNWGIARGHYVRAA